MLIRRYIMKTSFLQKKCDVKYDKEFNELNSAEKEPLIDNISEDEYSFYNKMLNDNNKTVEILPRKKVKQNLDIAFNKKNRTKRIHRYKPLLNVAASLIIGIMIFGAYQFNSRRKAADEAYNIEVTNVLMNLGRLEDQNERIVPSYYYDEDEMEDLEQK